MTENIYAQVQQKCLNPNTKRRVSVSGVLRKLDVSRSGYNDWLHRKPSVQKSRKERVKQDIQIIYDQSHQNYGAPKICKVIQQKGDAITERTVGKYMKEMGIRAQILTFEYIEAFYNTVRIHGHCDYMSPTQFEAIYRKIKKII